jgi:hypothetical protein
MQYIPIQVLLTMQQSHLPCIDHHHQDPLGQGASHLNKQREKWLWKENKENLVARQNEQHR